MASTTSNESRIWQPTGDYIQDPFKYQRIPTREVKVGPVGVGGKNPIRIQTMCISDTMDTEAIINETIQLYEAGSEFVRITAPGKKQAANLGVIKEAIKKRGLDIPLVADIHFAPAAAMVAVEHVEKVRINPGNYTDSKRFKVIEYTDDTYQEELEKVHDAFKPLVLRAKELGRAIRIGTNHGSLSDRILNRFGDTPLGMVESAVEFIKIAELYDYHDIIVSMKASNPGVMVQAYRMLVERFGLENMNYPLHLGVTEAGDGQDGRVKSAIGIGSLLEDGIGDTIRVSLTEDSIHEIPVARQIAARYNTETAASAAPDQATEIQNYRKLIKPYESGRLNPAGIPITEGENRGPLRVLAKLNAPESTDINRARELKEKGVDLLIVEDPAPLLENAEYPGLELPLVQEISQTALGQAASLQVPEGVFGLSLVLDDAAIPEFESSLKKLLLTARNNLKYFIHLRLTQAEAGQNLEKMLASLKSTLPQGFTLSLENTAYSFENPAATDVTGLYRLAAVLLHGAETQSKYSLLIRHTFASEDELLYGGAVHAGGLLLDGIGDGLLLEDLDGKALPAGLSLDILQTMRLRMTRTEYISCPSCGRTLFDLQDTTARIKTKTGHLKGVKIAVMGCIVNGPGEMADADFGYVGAGPGMVHLYREKEIIKSNVPAAIADEELIKLIKDEGFWQEPG